MIFKHFPSFDSGIPVSTRILGALVLATLCATVGCYSSHTVDSHTEYQYSFPPPLRTPQAISLVAPTVGLFIGVSEYGERSQMPPTPAHTLGAAFMYSPFFNAATRADSDDRKDALGIPDDNYFRDHAKSVCAVAFSPDETQFATAAEDGTVTLRATDLNIAPVQLGSPSDKGSSSCVLAFSPDGSHLLSGNADETISIWPIKTKGDPLTLRPPKAPHSVAYSPDGTRLLMTSYGQGATMMSSDGKSEPVTFTSDKQCFSVPPAAFSPDGRFIGSSGCSDVRIASVDDPANLRVLGKHTSSVNSLSFSHDGTRIVTTGADGTRIWPVKGSDAPKLLPILTGTTGTAGAAEKATFSPDDTLLAVAYSKGTVQLWHADGSGDPVTLGGSGKGCRYLAFSGDGKYILKVSDGGVAWIRDVAAKHHVMFLPTPDAPKGKWDGIDTSEAIKKGKLPPRRFLAIEAAAFTSDAGRVVVGYQDGTVAVHPGGRPDAKRGFRADDLTLLADLTVSANTPNSELAIQYLIQTDGIAEQMAVQRKDNSPEESAVYYVGSGQPVTRKRILDALSRSIAKASRILETQKRVVLVTYVAAHGWIGSDGRQYLLPSDADASDSNTWISYDEFLQPIRAFLANENKESPYYDPIRGDMSRLAVVIFDTCQVTRAGEVPKVATSDLSQRNLMVVQSTSPGRYSWHWTATVSTTGNTTIEKESRWGFPPPPKAKRGPISTELSAKMSVLPVASQNVLNALQADKTPKSIPGVGILALESDEAAMISAGEWMAETRGEVDHLLKQIPEASNPELSGKAQDVQLQADPKQYDFWLFRVTHVNKPPKPPDKEDEKKPGS